MRKASTKRRQQLMDAAQQKEAVSRFAKDITPEMKAKVNAMAIRSKAAGSANIPEMNVPKMAQAIRSKAVAADEHLRSEADRALRFVRKPKTQLHK